LSVQVARMTSIEVVGWAKARLRRAHRFSRPAFSVGTLRFAHPTNRLLDDDDPIYAWREKLLDAFDGLARKSPGFAV